MSDAKKVYPTAEELIKIESNLTCTEDGCMKTFGSSSNLILHLVKTHKKTALMPPKEAREFYCPKEGCIYNSNKFFKTMKDIRQHYRKVHMVKNISCESCKKTFLSEQKKKNHIEYCGVFFECPDCDVRYASYEILITHARRKSHQLLPKSAFRKNPETVDQKPANEKPKPVGHENKVTPATSTLLLPKPVCHIIVIPVQEKSEKQAVEKNTVGTQTDGDSCKQKVKKERANTKRNSRQTQTLYRKKPKLSVQTTQTLDDLFDCKESSRNILNQPLSSSKKSIKTQTSCVESLSFNNIFSFDTVDFSVDCGRTTSSTQTQEWPNDAESSTNACVNDTSGIMDFNHSFDTNFFNCNTQTQTDFFLDDDLLNCNYYSDTHTQTCEDMLLGDIGFTDIETQTAIQDVCSVESQTLMSHTRRNNTGYRDISHIETQTDIEFKKMLEEINS